MAATFFVALMFAGQVPAETDAAKAQQQKWYDYYARTAADYEINRGQDGKEELDLKPQPVLHWSNPVRGGDTNGSVFVWTYQGRAELVGTVFSHLVVDDPSLKVMAHSFQSLSQEPLAGSRPGKPGQWSLAEVGVVHKPIKGAPTPARSRPGRLAQMRDLAREFTATTVLDGVEQDLRLLTQPLHRQEKPVEESLDGALFTFVTGTDPELMLVIEARPADGTGDPIWHYAAGRFTDLPLTLRHKEIELWTHTQGARIDGRRDPYITGRYEMLPRVMP